MFSKLSILAAAITFVSALTLDAPSNPTSGGTVTIKWTPAAGDPQVFSLQLTNEAFHNTFAIANNVNTGQNSLTLELPTLPPGDGYTIIAHDISDINKVYGQTGDFSVGAATTSSAASTTSAPSSGTVPPTGSGTTLISVTPNTSAFGTTVRNTATSAGSAASTAAAGAASSSAPSSAMAVKFGFSAASVSAVALSVVAGAAILAL